MLRASFSRMTSLHQQNHQSMASSLATQALRLSIIILRCASLICCLLLRSEMPKICPASLRDIVAWKPPPPSHGQWQQTKHTGAS